MSKWKEKESDTPFYHNLLYGSVNPYRKNDPIQILFIEDLVLFVTKGNEVIFKYKVRFFLDWSCGKMVKCPFFFCKTIV
jgi:hypothetical protein